MRLHQGPGPGAGYVGRPLPRPAMRSAVARPLALVALAALAGCTYTRPLDLGDPAGRQRLTERAARQPATVAVRGERPALAHGLSVRADSAVWVDPATGRARAVASSEIESVSFPTTHPRPGQAFVRGLLGGIALGAVVGVLTYDGPDWFVSSPADAALLAGSAGGVIGGTVGGLVSLDRLSPERFVRVGAPGAGDGP